MSKKIFYLPIFILTFTFCKKDNKSENLENNKVVKIDSLANRYLELNRFSGTIVVAKGEEIIYNQSFGLADYENKIPFSDITAFKIGEITKIITDNIVHQLIALNKLQLTDNLSKYMEDIKSDLTINDLLSANKSNKNDLEYQTLGKLIEKISGKTFQENLTEYGKGLGLQNTYFQKEDALLAVGYLYHNYRGNGLELQKSPSYNLEKAFSSNGLKSTAGDLVKIIQSNPLELKIEGYLENDGFSYSLVHHVENNLSMIVLSNRRHPVAGEISQSIEAILKGKAYRTPLARKPFSINSELLNDYTGKYALNENVSFEVISSQDSLYVLLGPNKVALIPQSENQFYMLDNDAAMRFEKDSTSVVNSARLLNGFIDSEQQGLRVD